MAVFKGLIDYSHVINHVDYETFFGDFSVFGDNLVCSIASEPKENSDAYVNQTAEGIKQDCESKAFVRLAGKIKKKFKKSSQVDTIKEKLKKIFSKQ